MVTVVPEATAPVTGLKVGVAYMAAAVTLTVKVLTQAVLPVSEVVTTMVSEDVEGMV